MKADDRVAEAIEVIADAMKEISKSTDAIQSSQKLLNDNFLLHQERSTADHKEICTATDGLKAEVHGVREDFKAAMYPVLRWLVIAIVTIAGGTAVAKLVFGL